MSHQNNSQPTPALADSSSRDDNGLDPGSNDSRLPDPIDLYKRDRELNRLRGYTMPLATANTE